MSSIQSATVSLPPLEIAAIPGGGYYLWITDFGKSLMGGRFFTEQKKGEGLSPLSRYLHFLLHHVVACALHLVLHRKPSDAVPLRPANTVFERTVALGGDELVYAQPARRPVARAARLLENRGELTFDNLLIGCHMFDNPFSDDNFVKCQNARRLVLPIILSGTEGWSSLQGQD